MSFSIFWSLVIDIHLYLLRYEYLQYVWSGAALRERGQITKHAIPVNEHLFQLEKWLI